MATKRLSLGPVPETYWVVKEHLSATHAKCLCTACGTEATVYIYNILSGRSKKCNMCARGRVGVTEPSTSVAKPKWMHSLWDTISGRRRVVKPVHTWDQLAFFEWLSTEENRQHHENKWVLIRLDKSQPHGPGNTVFSMYSEDRLAALESLMHNRGLSFSEAEALIKGRSRAYIWALVRGKTPPETSATAAAKSAPPIQLQVRVLDLAKQGRSVAAISTETRLPTDKVLAICEANQVTPVQS